jgi:AcrR family transcriptional regulator
MAKQEQILNKARDVFARHGYRKTTVEDIARACALGKAALYHYFSSKEEIFAEVVRAESRKILAQIRTAVDAADGPKAQLVAMLKTSFNAVSVAIAELVENKRAAELRASLPLAAEALRQFLDEEVEILRKILETGARQGVFRKITSPSVPLVIISGLRGVQFHILEVEKPPVLEDAIDSVLDLFLEGICR